jgi:hypothetical protein
MKVVTLKVGKPTKAQKVEARRKAEAMPIANRAKGVTYTLANGKPSSDPRALVVRERVILAILTKASVEITDLYIHDLTDTEYSADRAPLYHIPHRSVSQVEGSHTMKVQAFVAGTITENKKAGTITGITSTKGDLARVFITPA